MKPAQRKETILHAGQTHPSPRLSAAPLILAALACGGEGAVENLTPSAATPAPVADGTPRPYRLGFTPFPYDISQEAVAFTYEALARDADLINHHFDDGVPWPEALSGEPFPEALRNEWAGRREAEQREMLFVVNFVLRDYDALAEKIGDSDLVRVWRDTGLYDEDGAPRPALDTWRAALARPHASAGP